MAQTQRRIVINFGTGRANLKTVGYQLLTAGKVPVGQRITDGIDIYEEGQYGFTVVLPPDFCGDCLVDTGQTVPKTLIVSCNPAFAPTSPTRTLKVIE